MKISTTNTDHHDREACEHDVGYARPPLHSRFKPGQSGNPKGRPKGRKNMGLILNDILKEPISIRKGNTIRKVSTAEAMVRGLVVRAMKGDAKAWNKLLELCAKYGEFDKPTPHFERIERIIIRPDDPRHPYANVGPPGWSPPKES